MRRFVTLAVLLLFTIPFGVSISGCSKGTSVVFCNGGDAGPIVGQASTITLLPKIYGISLNQGQIGQVSTPTATDCKGSTVTVTSYTYGVFDANGKATLDVADVVPSGTEAGKLCAGTWNRNTGGGIPDYTTCNATGKTGDGLRGSQRQRRQQQPAADLRTPEGHQRRSRQSDATQCLRRDRCCRRSSQSVLQLLPALEAGDGYGGPLTSADRLHLAGHLRHNWSHAPLTPMEPTSPAR